MAGRMLRVTEKAVQDAIAHGVGGDVKSRVARMATRSAPYTCPFGNRRFENFVLDLWDGEVRAVRRIDPETGDRIFTEHETREILQEWSKG